MAQTAQKLEWSQLDTSALPANLKKSYATVQAAQKAAKEARDVFEKELEAVMTAQKIIPAGKAPLFSYRFGNLSVAFDAIKTPKAKQAMIQLKPR